MPTTRQDAWSKEEDVLLADIVLRCIKDGGTQLQAFEEVGKQLSRTSAACGFRWNSFVRKQYKSKIELAKAQRKQLKKGILLVDEQIFPKEQEELNKESVEKIDNRFKEIILYLKDIFEKAQRYDKLEVQDEKQQMLQDNIKKLTTQNNLLQIELQTRDKSYKDLVDLMEQARKMVESK